MDPDDDADDPREFTPPLPPEDRLWRHPSELGPGPAPGPAPSSTRALPASDPRSVWGVAAASAAIGAVVSIGVLLAVGLADERDQPIEERRVPASVDVDAAELAQATLPAIVRLEVARGGGEVDTGTGVLFRDDGHVLTTADVLGAAAEVTAVLHDGRTVAGRVVGTDAANDIGVVDLDLDGAPTAAIGSAAALQPGEAVTVISAASHPGAAPFVARTVVTDRDRSIALADGTALYGMLTVTGAIGQLAPGSVLLDQSGGVVAVSTDRYPEGATRVAETDPAVELTVARDGSLPGVGSAWLVPVDFAHEVAGEIIDAGRPRHAWLGVVDHRTVGIEPLRSPREGAWVADVADGSPASEVGLRPDDVIVTLAGRRITTMDDLVITLRSLEPGDAVPIEYLRDGDRRSCRPVLDESGA